MFTLNGFCGVGKGYVANEVELRRLSGGSNRAVVEVPISFQRYYKGSNGEYVRNSHFIPCVFYGTHAERFADVAGKGSLVIVTGYVEQESFTIKGTDKKATRHRVVVEDFSICEKPVRNGNDNGNGNGQTSNASKPAEQEPDQRQDQGQQQPEQQAPPVNKLKKAATSEPAPPPETQQEDDGTGVGAPELPF